MDATVVVTGATGGIGASVCRAFADEGASVVCSGRDADALDALVDDLDGATGVRADVRDEFDMERLMEQAARVDDGIDVVVPVAGVYHGDAGATPLAGESYAAWDDTMRTNARGVYAAVREALPHLAADGRVVVPTGSVAREPGAGYGTYAVSKAAAEAVARGFAAELDQTVGCVDPGVVATDLTGGRGRDPEAVAPQFVWAAQVDPDVLDGEVLTRADWTAATRD
ncbi:SDR family oxidoreductase [Halobacteriaceae archaeon GCM10025711]